MPGRRSPGAWSLSTRLPVAHNLESARQPDDSRLVLKPWLRIYFIPNRKFSSVIAPTNPDFTPEAARSLLQLRFSAEDISRMNELAAKSRAGALTDDEERMLEGFRFIGSMIEGERGA